MIETMIEIMIVCFSYSSSCSISEPPGSNDFQKNFQLISSRKGIKVVFFVSSLFLHNDSLMDVLVYKMSKQKVSSENSK